MKKNLNSWAQTAAAVDLPKHNFLVLNRLMGDNHLDQEAAAFGPRKPKPVDIEGDHDRR